MAWYDWIINPLKPAIEYINENWFDSPQPDKADELQRYNDVLDDIGDAASKFYDDITGVSAVKLQNELEKERAEAEYKRNLDSIGDTADAYSAAGFNRNMVYGSGSGSPVHYSAPDLQAYTGSGRIDTVLSRVGKVLGSIPAIYNASAALEKIDQEREKTVQSQLYTNSMVLSLLDKASRLDSFNFGRPYDINFALEKWRRDTRRRIPFTLSTASLFHDPNRNNDGQISDDYKRYHSAAMKNQFNLLESIGLSNDLRRTRNSYLGYQYELDRKFGDLGRVIGLAGNAIGGLGNLLKIPAAFMTKKTKVVK